MTSKTILAKLADVLRPGCAISNETAPLIASELRRYAAVLDELPKASDPSTCAHDGEKPQKRGRRSFNFSRVHSRYIALQVMYIGWKYHGFASQKHEPNTIEGHLFRALEKTCLIPAGSSWEDVRYTRCGRTDVGVSAVGQVVTVQVRSRAAREVPLPAAAEELDYPLVLNKVLPPEIQITGWTPAADTFHARFSANFREYKYFISDAQNLDITAMKQAAKSLEGEHDFQNFCKMDLDNTMTHTRRIVSAEILPVFTTAGSSLPDTVVFLVRGTAFLWHQVRCMAAVLIMVGRGAESPDIVPALLNVAQNPRKPQYQMASELPLLFHSAGFNDLNFDISQPAARAVLGKLQTMRRERTEELALLCTVHDKVKALHGESQDPNQQEFPPHVPLLARGRDPSFAEKLVMYKRRKGAIAEESRLPAAQCQKGVEGISYPT